jgi:GH15 family glucan-1,4-alpha-glucosidase
MTGSAPTRRLVGRSIDVIATHQAPTGAYLAAPAYDTYSYSWLRDGSFIAAAMGAHGHGDSAAAFHRWVARTVEQYAHKIERLEAQIDSALAGTGDPMRPLDDRYTLHTRFTVDSDEGGEHWGDFQLDGYGFWLTSVARHLTLSGEDPAPFRPAVDLVRRYLAATWQLACFDCWEEYPTRRHMTTWAAVARGLRDSVVAGLSPTPAADDIERRLEAAIGPASIMRKFVPDDRPAPDVPAAEAAVEDEAVAGHERIGRSLHPDAIDGSALLVLGDFGPFAPESAIVGATARAIEDELVVDGGVHRYLEDEYYGGGLWIVLAGALAVVLAPRDERRAGEVLGWIEQQATATGDLPEQVATHMRKPGARQGWIERWGEPAQALLWSHAMYLLGVAATDR